MENITNAQIWLFYFLPMAAFLLGTLISRISSKRDGVLRWEDLVVAGLPGFNIFGVALILMIFLFDTIYKSLFK